MKNDIEKKVNQDFKDNVIALKYLQEVEKNNNFSDRVLRCIVYLSNGNIESLIENIKIAERDWRDIIYYAEDYDFKFNTPFTED